jgi:hypothetical protein
MAALGEAANEGPSVAASVSRVDSLRLDEDQRLVLRRRLTDILALDAFYMIGKLQRLRFNHNNLYLQAEIVTDLRPVYARREPLNITNTLIWHTLRVHVDNHGQSSVVEFALERADLQDLREQIDRALSKEKAAAERLRLLEMKVASE